MFGQVGDQVDQAQDQVGQGQGQELDNIEHIQQIDITYYYMKALDSSSQAILGDYCKPFRLCQFMIQSIALSLNTGKFFKAKCSQLPLISLTLMWS